MKNQTETEKGRLLKIKALKAMTGLPRWYMQDVVAYDSSLDNAAGKLLVYQVANGIVSDERITNILEIIAENLKK